MIVFSSPMPSEQQTSSGANGVVDVFWTKKGKRVYGTLTTLIIEVLNSTKALTDIFESREPVDNLSLKHYMILNTAWKSWTSCWQCFLKRLLSIRRNLKRPSLTTTSPQPPPCRSTCTARRDTAWQMAVCPDRFHWLSLCRASLCGGSVVKVVTR